MLDLDSEKGWRLKMEAVWIHLHRGTSVSWDRGYYQRGNIEIKNKHFWWNGVPNRSYKASGYEFSGQKIPKFAKNVT